MSLLLDINGLGRIIIPEHMSLIELAAGQFHSRE